MTQEAYSPHGWDAKKRGGRDVDPTVPFKGILSVT
jgi:hypothetical protein